MTSQLFLASVLTAGLAGAPPAPSGPPASTRLAIEDYDRAAARWRDRASRRRPAERPVSFQFAHQFEDVPEVFFTDAIKRSADRILLQRAWSLQERSFAEGQVTDAGVTIVSIDELKKEALCEYKGRRFTARRTPPPPKIVCKGITPKGSGYIAKLQVGLRHEEEFHAGEDVDEVHIVEINKDTVRCRYFGLEATFRAPRTFPELTFCRAVQSTREGPVLHVQDGSGFKRLRPGDRFRELTVAGVDADGATFEFDGRQERVAVARVPSLRFHGMGSTKGRTVGYVDAGSGNTPVTPGQELQLKHGIVRIDAVLPMRLIYRFQGVPLELERVE